MSDLEHDIKVMIIDVLNLEDVSPEDIDAQENLFGDNGLALDSIDALEIGVGVQKKYGIKINAEDKSTRAHFQSVRSLAEFVAAQQAAA
ncbi:acyl carrier protein [Caulobacter sp. SLTY]|uniref:phosphopantetheine-binding protein n=1 Tax=Caulobacter sp. SLTY TaxID=2683262 RepID=UPI0014128D51|nr:phosphopantetheine-binding protein [Caulobacter sp. SLTY]NBB14715.1 acyl carrier protein [Caulobacter sp. SLTY]